MYAARLDATVCTECGHVQPDSGAAGRVECENCGHLLYQNRPHWLDKAMASTVTAAILFIVVLTFPFVGLETIGLRQDSTVFSGILALVDRGQWLLASLVFVTVILTPLAEVSALLYTLFGYRMRRRLPHQIRVFRWLVVLQPWSMLEIFALAVLVTLVKVGDTANLVPGVGMYAFFGLVAALMGAYFCIHKRLIWSWLRQQNYFVEARGEQTVGCRICCAQVGLSIVHAQGSCPRCGGRLHERTPHSFQKTAALVLAAAILYIPANFLPMMSYSSFGSTRTDTIFTGVVKLASDGLWWVAIVVFVASIVVPIAKLVVLTYLLWVVRTGTSSDTQRQQMLFRVTEVIGRWSMVDVYVVTLLVALVQFGFFGKVEPQGAIVAFGGVVVLTMFATHAFDPRLLKDSQRRPPGVVAKTHN